MSVLNAIAEGRDIYNWFWEKMLSIEMVVF
jgi:hypothetical protein